MSRGFCQGARRRATGTRVLSNGSSACRQWTTPPEAGEAAVVTIGGDELAPRFNCQRGEPRIGNQIASRARIVTQSHEDLPMSRAGLDRHSIRLLAKRIREGERSIDRRRRMEDSRMCHDPEKATQHMVGNSIDFVRLHQAHEPLSVRAMLRSVLAKGVDENVHVSESQRDPPQPSAQAMLPYRRDRRLVEARSR